MTFQRKHTVFIFLLALFCSIPFPLLGQTAGKDETIKKNRYLVKLQPNADRSLSTMSAVTSRIVPDSSQAVLRQIPRFGLFAANVDEKGFQALRNHPQVAHIEPDHKRYLSSQFKPYGISMVQADQLTDLHGENITVCIIDSGIDLIHEDLSQNSITGTDFYGSGNWYEDTNDHGTHVAGTVAAVSNDVGVLGVLPNTRVKLHITRVFDPKGQAYSSDILDALAQCVSPGVEADVVNMSFGSLESSLLEEETMQNVADTGVLLVAAAGNDGTTAENFPASYDSVISVAALDQNKNRASFSQQNNKVELAAPGVSVLSTVPSGSVAFSTSFSQFYMGSDFYTVKAMNGSPDGEVDGALADCGIGDVTCPDAVGKICLIERGSLFFWEKVLACESGGGTGAVIYNNAPGSFTGTLSDVVTTIPSVSLAREDGLLLLDRIGESAHLSLGVYTDYEEKNGTSMATPHVVGTAALIWSYHHDTCSAGNVRQALAETAEDLGTPGLDTSFGHGLIQGQAVKLYLDATCGAGIQSLSDHDVDNDIDGQDLALMANRFSSRTPSADINRDGIIDIADIRDFASVYGN